MLGVDTNVLVRFLAEDDTIQTQQARKLFFARTNQPIYISMLVLAETFTVMTKLMKFPVGAVLETYGSLLSSPQIRVECPDLVSAALDDAKRTRADFPDALIALQNAQAGCAATATFDVRATRLDGMDAVEVHL